ncbi:MAG: hypothetical protein M1813_003663 [Trichoglossum hirsutum]|nr:MAG: hypothetical protein M1813_003663 [Trichoglossum hirsutum]
MDMIDQVVLTGSSLVLLIYKVSVALKSAKTEVEAIANEIGVLSSVLRQLDSLLGEIKEDCHQTLVEDVKETVSSCRKVYNEIEELVGGVRKDGTRMAIQERATWISKNKREVRRLKGTLESQKSSLLLMLMTVGLMKKISTSSDDMGPNSEIGQQLSIVQDLVISQISSRKPWAFEDMESSDGVGTSASDSGNDKSPHGRSDLPHWLSESIPSRQSRLLASSRSPMGEDGCSTSPSRSSQLSLVLQNSSYKLTSNMPKDSASDLGQARETVGYLLDRWTLPHRPCAATNPTSQGAETHTNAMENIGELELSRIEQLAQRSRVNQNTLPSYVPTPPGDRSRTLEQRDTIIPNNHRRSNAEAFSSFNFGHQELHSGTTSNIDSEDQGRLRSNQHSEALAMQDSVPRDCQRSYTTVLSNNHSENRRQTNVPIMQNHSSDYQMQGSFPALSVGPANYQMQTCIPNAHAERAGEILWETRRRNGNILEVMRFRGSTPISRSKERWTDLILSGSEWTTLPASHVSRPTLLGLDCEFIEYEGSFYIFQVLDYNQVREITSLPLALSRTNTPAPAAIPSAFNTAGAMGRASDRVPTTRSTPTPGYDANNFGGERRQYARDMFDSQPRRHWSGHRSSQVSYAEEHVQLMLLGFRDFDVNLDALERVGGDLPMALMYLRRSY